MIIPMNKVPSQKEQTAAQDKILHHTSFEDGTYENEQGGRQTKLLGDLTLLPPIALLAISTVLKSGAEKYGKDNWRKISVEENLNHCMYHIIMYLMKDDKEDHLVNASCRLLFALDVLKRPLNSEKINTEQEQG